MYTLKASQKQKESDGQHQVEKRLKLLQIYSPLEDIAIFGCRHLCAIWNQQKAFVPQEISTTTCSSSIVVLQSSDRHINCYSERVTVYVHTAHNCSTDTTIASSAFPPSEHGRGGEKIDLSHKLLARNSGAVWIRRLHRATVRNKKKEEEEEEIDH
ncbi:conserved hypothetical protein [Trichinella spiralis]|uniref:hypothetical protein n=1 Tax=Trichinella spiralis TaxID=6334 RepID=UPI0001EFD7EC|nr:conserved hypothetical protein [Trichinella spiralis]